MDKPTFTIFKRRQGGRKVCGRCQTAHPEVVKGEDGKAFRPKVCERCGTALPKRLTFKGKAPVVWYVRETDPVTAATKDEACNAREEAEELIRRREAAWTADPVQAALIEKLTVTAKTIDAPDLDAAIDAVIVALGGDAARRTLKAIDVQEAIEAVCSEIQTKDNAGDAYVRDMRRVAQHFVKATRLQTWADLSSEHVKVYIASLAAKGRERNTIRRHTRTLRAAVGRLVANRVAHPRVLDKSAAGAWTVAAEAVEHEYMPDAALFAVLKAAGDDAWLRCLVLLAYNSAARLSDLLRLTWADIDLEGGSDESGRVGPTVRIANTKHNKRAAVKRPVFVPLDDAVVEALRTLRAKPVGVFHRHTPPADRVLKLDENGGAVLSERVFPIRGFKDPVKESSRLVSGAFIRAGFVTADGSPRWTCHDLRRKSNIDLLRAGATLREAMGLCGHSSEAVNIANYQSGAEPRRLRELFAGVAAFKGLRLAKQSA